MFSLNINKWLACIGLALSLNGCGVFLSSTAPSTLNGPFGGKVGQYRVTKADLLKALAQLNIQYVHYGDTITLIVPTDRYFRFNSARFNERCLPGLGAIITLLNKYPPCAIYVAGFTNDIGSSYHKQTLTQAQAEAMLTYLWANNIPARRLNAEGYADKHAVSDNKLVHGAAQNRRLEVQLLYSCAITRPASIKDWGYIK